MLINSKQKTFGGCIKQSQELDLNVKISNKKIIIDSKKILKKLPISVINDTVSNTSNNKNLDVKI